MVAKRVWESLPQAMRITTRAQALPGIQADGSEMNFQGVMELTGQIRGSPIRKMFTIRETEEDAILGMPLLIGRECVLDFERLLLRISGRIVVCTEADGASMQYRSGWLGPHQLLLGPVHWSSERVGI